MEPSNRVRQRRARFGPRLDVPVRVAEARVLEVAVDVRDAEVEVLLVLRALAHVHEAGRREVDGPTLA